MISSFVIVGAGGHGREVLDIAESMGLRARVAGFADDAPPDAVATERLTRRDASVLGDVGWLVKMRLPYVIAIGSSSARRVIDAALGGGSRATSPVLAHSSSTIGSENCFGDGVVIGSNSTVTTNVTLGRHTHVNVGCSIQHDSVVGDYVTFSPGVLVNGDVTVGDDVFVGTGAILTRGCRIGAGAIVGAGAVVLDDVAPGSKVLGVPATPH